MSPPELDLTALKPGDRLGIKGRGYDTRYTSGTVNRLTVTQVVVAEDTSGAPSYRRFRIKDGGEIGVGYGAESLVHPDDPGLLAYEARQAFSVVANLAEHEWREIRNSQNHVGTIQVWERMQLLKAEITAAQAKVSSLIARMPKPERAE